MEPLVITREGKKLTVRESNLSDSDVRESCLDRTLFNDVSMQGIKIVDANLSDLEIEDAQLGGAYIHNIGMPPAGHPYYDPDAKQRPLRFENCDLAGSTWRDCNLSGAAFTDCQVKGMTINGLLVEDLLRSYHNH